MEHSSDSSFLQLVKSLAGEQWRNVCSIVLDITGEFRNAEQPDERSCRVILQDVETEMHMAGRLEDATTLSRLGESLCGEDGAHAALQTLLLCVRNVRNDRWNWRDDMFEVKVVRETMEEINEPVKTTSAQVFTLGLKESVMNIEEPSQDETAIHQVEPIDIFADCAQFERQNVESYLRKHIDATRSEVARADPDISRRLFGHSDLQTPLAKMLQSENEVMGHMQEQLSEIEASVPGSHNTAIRLVLQSCILGSSSEISTKERETEASKPLCLHTTVLERVASDEEMRAEVKKIVAQRRSMSEGYRGTLKKLATCTVLLDEDEDLIERAQICGLLYQSIYWFVQYCRFIPGKRVLQAVKSFCETVATSYHCSVIKAAEDNLNVESGSWAVLETAQADAYDLRQICDVLEAIETSDGSACKIIDIVCKKSMLRPHCELIRGLFHAAMQPYLEWIWDWIFEEVADRDADKEFFCNQLGISASGSEDIAGTAGSFPKMMSEEDALFILRAGRSHALLSQLGVDLALGGGSRFERGDGDIFERFQVAVQKVMERMEGGEKKKDVLSPLVTAMEGDISDVSDSSESVSREEAAEAEVERKQDRLGIDMPDAFSIPKGTECSVDGRLKVFTNTLSDAQSTVSLTTSDESRSGLHAFPSHCVEIVLRQVSEFDKIVQKRLVDHFWSLGLRDHLNTLRQYALLGAGDFSNMFVEQVEMAARKSYRDERYLEKRALAARTFYGSADVGSRHGRDLVHIQRCLRVALNLCNVSDEFVDCLSMSVGGGAVKSLWDCKFCVEYACGFPMEVVINRKSVDMYSSILDLFVHIIRARRSLACLFVMTRRPRAHRIVGCGRKIIDDKQVCGLVYEFCLQAESFVCGFGGYEMQQVLDVGWNELVQMLDQVTSIWDMREAHMKFVSGGITRCLLGQGHGKVLSVMRGGLEIVTSVRVEVERVIGGGGDCEGVKELLKSGCMSLKRRGLFLTQVVGLKV